MRTLLAVLIAAGAAASACRSSVPLAPARTSPDAWLEVPYPPPPARAEVIPQRPAQGALWVDGGWAWVNGAWLWESGAWVKVPPGVWRASWGLARAPDGRLYLAPGTWRDAQGRRVKDLEALVSAQVVR